MRCWFLLFLLALFTATGLALSPPFDVREATIATVHSALFSRLTTCRDVVAAFLARIEKFDPALNAVITLNPDALDIADSLDKKLSIGNATGSLFCIPVLLKDNFDALPLATTGGCEALRFCMPLEDGPVVTALRRAGAVILGKTNLQELALEGLSLSSLGGQTFNPYDQTRTPGGSSGGTGAAVAASFAVLGTGTDTVNSLRSPASANSLFSFRPTRGLISRAGIIPVSHTQDAVGAIGRSVMDIAVALNVMASASLDARDNVTSLGPPFVLGTDYAAALSPLLLKSLSGLRIGVLRGFFSDTVNNETAPVNEAMARVESLIAAAGATVISLNDSTTYNATRISDSLDVQQFEYRESLTSYLSSPSLSGTHPSSMPDLYLHHSPNFLVIPSQYRHIRNALQSSTGDSSYQIQQDGITYLTSTLHAEFSTHDLDAIIYPEQKNLVVPIGWPNQSGRNGILAALTGSPVVTIPIGFSPATDTAPIGIPIGMEILGLPWTETRLLSIAKGIDDRLHARKPPILLTKRGLDDSVGEENEEEQEIVLPVEYTAVPKVTPLRNIDLQAYPTGIF